MCAYMVRHGYHSKLPLAEVYDILFGMRRCRIKLPNRCYHLISRVAHRALEFGGLQAANRKGRYDKEELLWQFTVAIRSDPNAANLSKNSSFLPTCHEI